MRKLSKYAVMFAIVMMLFPAFIYGAEEKGADAPPGDLAEEGWISNGKALGPWWQRNPKKYDPMALPLLYHLEVNYSFMDKGGNTDMESHKGSLSLTLRKSVFTIATSYENNKQETTRNLNPVPMTMLVESQTFMQDFMVALTDWMGLNAGFIWLKNDSTKYLEDRKVYYGGVRLNAVDSPGLRIMLGAAYGYVDSAYMNDEIPKPYNCPPVDDYDSDMLFGNLILNWDITDIISFSETARYQLFLKDTEYYNWKSDTSLNFKVTENISFTATYGMSYDYNSFTEHVQDCLDAVKERGEPAGEIEELDTTLSLGITLKF
jgi:putative salt-induced outer membrane protein YdiY